MILDIKMMKYWPTIKSLKKLFECFKNLTDNILNINILIKKKKIKLHFSLLNRFCQMKIMYLSNILL